MGVANSREYRDVLESIRRNERGHAKVQLDYIELSEKDCLKLADALAVNRRVKHLCLGACALSPRALQHLTRSLYGGFTRIRRLDLSTQGNPAVGNPLGDEGAEILAQVISRSAQLQHVRAASCDIGEVGGAAIADALIGNDHLLTLDLSHNHISDRAAESLGHALQNNHTLEGLLLWKNNLFYTGAEHIANGLQVNNTLQWLGIGCNSVGDAGAKAIAVALITNIEHSSLHWLSLGGNKITDQGARYLATLLEPQSAAAIPNLVAAIQVPHTPALFRTNKFTANLVAMAASGSSHSLAASSESEFSFPSGSAPDLVTGVSHDLASHDLQSASHDLSPQSHSLLHSGTAAAAATGTGEVAAAEEKLCSGVESLGLGGNDIGDIGATTLALALMHNECLRCLGLADNRIGDEGAQSLAELVRHSDTLEKLVLSNNNIRDEGAGQLIASLSQNSSLKGLYLAGNSFGDSFSVRCTEVIGRHNTTLKSLDIRNTRLSRPAAQSLVDSMGEVGVVNCLATDATYSRDAQPSHLKIQPLKGRHLLSAQRSVDVMTSLPAPEQSAQMLVIEVGKQEMKKRKGSMTDLFRRLSRSGSRQRLFSRKASSSKIASNTGRQLNSLPEETDSNTYTVSSGGKRSMKKSRGSIIQSPTTETMELHTLVEEDENIDELPQEEETQYFTSVEDHVINDTPIDHVINDTPIDHVINDTPTDHVIHDTRIQWTLPDDQQITQTEHEASNRNSIRDSFLSDNTTSSNRISAFDIPHQGSLSSITKDRPRPPKQRRRPLRTPSERSEESRSSLWSGSLQQRTSIRSDDFPTDLSSPSSMNEEVDRSLPATTRILATSKPIENSEDPVLSATTNTTTRPLRDQWTLSLAQRIGVLRMGGFLHGCFQAIENTPPSDTFDYTAATLMINQSKNREGAPLPPGQFRVKLLLMFDLIGSDYINASYVGRPGNQHGYIASQAPTDSTVADFWRMIWEHGVHVVVAVSDDNEEECARYWPWELGVAEEYGLVISGSWVNEGFTVTMTSENSCAIGDNCLVRTFHLSSRIEQEERTVKQFHYTGWPHKGVPTGVDEVARLVLTTRRYHDSITNAGPTLVHGSLGVGRTGCFCAVTIAIEMMELAKESSIDAWSNDSNILDQVIRGLRSQRPGMVESCDQYEFCYRLLEESLWGETAKTNTSSSTDHNTKTKKSKFKLFKRKRK